MAKIVFGMNQSLDGYVDHQAFAPDPVLFRHFIDQPRRATGSVYGRRLYFAGQRPPLRLAASDRIGEDAIRLTYVPASSRYERRMPPNTAFRDNEFLPAWLRGGTVG